MDKVTQQSQKKSSRRLIIVTGDKGGVGKSTFTRGLIHSYLDRKQRFLAFDADTSNSQLKRFYGNQCPIQTLDIFARGQIDHFLDNLKNLVDPQSQSEDGEPTQSEDLFLLELPPQSMRIFKEFVEDMIFFEILQDYDIRVTMVVVISRVKDSVTQLLNLYNFCRYHVDYIIVKNLFFGEANNFLRYLESEEIKQIQQAIYQQDAKYVDITMPDLIETTYDYLDQNNMTFQQGKEQTDKPSVKGRVTSWLKKFQEQIMDTQDLLGFDSIQNQAENLGGERSVGSVGGKYE